MKRLLARGLALALPLLGVSPALAAAPKKAPAKAAAPARSAPQSKPPAGWQQLDAKDAGFSAWFPGEPERKAESQGGMHMIGYGLDKTEPETSFIAMMISVGPLGEKLVEEVLFPALTDGAKIQKDEKVTVDGHAARALLLSGDSSNIALRRFTAFDRQYILAVRVPGGAKLPDADVKTFFDSFRISEKAELPADEDAATAKEGGEGTPLVAEKPTVLPDAKPATGFKQFVAKDAGFAIAFPGEPARQQDGSMIDYEVKAADGTCTFSAMTFASDDGKPLPEVSLELFAAQMAERFGAGVTRNEAITLAGLPARALSVGVDEERIEVRLILAGGRLHTLLISAEKATPSVADQKAFFESFKTL